MARWMTRRKENGDTPAIDLFIEEIIAVCKKHGMSISHEDGHGAFVIENEDNERNFDWLRDASDNTAPPSST